MAGDPLVSVVLPFYNAPFLKEAIESILNQTYRNLELILVDNASTDDSKDVAKSYSKNPLVTLIEESKRGVVFAVNSGIMHAKGDFIARMDADDLSFPGRLEEQVKLLKAKAEIDVVSGSIQYLGDNTNQGFIEYVNWLNSIMYSDEIYFNQFVEFPLTNPSLMFRQDVFEKYGLYHDGDFPEDYEFFLRLMSNNLRFEKVNSPVLIWRDTETRLTRTNVKYTQEAFFKIKAKYLAHWLSENNSFHPRVMIWGGGRMSRKRSDLLKEYGIEVEGYIDVKQSDQFIYYQNIDLPGQYFIVSYVSNRGKRNEIRAFLKKKGYEEGKDFILAA